VNEKIMDAKMKRRDAAISSRTSVIRDLGLSEAKNRFAPKFIDIIDDSMMDSDYLLAIEIKFRALCDSSYFVR